MVLVVICNVGTAAAMVNVNDWVAVWAVGVVESVTFVVKVKVPEAVGVPESMPPAESVKPAGSAPELMLQVYGVVPPDAASVVEYAVPTWPAGTEVVVI
jgi:hypothetical protein